MISSAKEFIRLRKSLNPKEYVRANEEDAPDEVWLEVIKKYPDMKKYVASNESLPAHILEILANDDDQSVRNRAASNHNISVSTLWRLSKDPNESVRHRVAVNPNSSIDILKFLENDPWENVVESAQGKLARLRIIHSAEEFVRLRFSTKPEEYMLAIEGNATDEVWLEIIEKYPNIKEWIATNKTISARILDILANDEEQMVRYATARNHNTSIDTLWRLAKDQDESVRLMVASNPCTPTDILKSFENDLWGYVAEVAKERIEKREVSRDSSCKTQVFLEIEN